MLTNIPSSQTNDLMADLSSVRLSYDGGTTWVLDGVDLTIRAGERICVIGGNGSGKSSLARILAGLIAPDSGQVELAGHRVFDQDGAHSDQYRSARKAIGAVFQNPADQIITTVTADDVAFGPENLSFEPALITEQVSSSLACVHMQQYAQADPTRLSGGQQQRVTIAGILAMRPSMIVLDEPTAMLDRQARIDVMAALTELQCHGVTIIHVTHKPQELEGADRIFRLNDGHIDEMTESDAAASLTTSGMMEMSEKARITKMTSQERQVVTATAPATSGSDAPALTLSHVSWRYPQSTHDTIHDLSFTIDQGETVAIMGHNGSGKSTLTRLISALQKPTSGTITVNGVGDLSKLSKHDRRKLHATLGLVMQQPEQQLFASTVRQDVTYGPRNLGLPEDEIARRVDTSLKLLGIEHLADRSPFTLSGGQQRLAAIAGVIACHPSILVLDEPGAGLDAQASARIEALIETMHERGVTVILVTHSDAQAERLADRIIRIDTDSTNGSDRIGETAVAPGSGPTSGHTTMQQNVDVHDITSTERDQLFGNADLSMESWLGRLDPRVKLLAILVLMFSAFAMGSPQELVWGSVMVAALAAAGRIDIMQLLSKTHGFLLLFVILGVFNMLFIRTGSTLFTLFTLSITTDGAISATLSICRLTLVILLGAILLETTTPTSLTDGFDSMLSPLRRFGIHSQETALVISLALRFVPTLYDEAKSVAQAQTARGGSIETGSPRARVKALVSIIVPVFAGAVRHADNLALALDARCFEEGIERTHWHQLKIQGRDIAFIAVCLIYALGLIGLHLMPWQPWR
jgi:energy-coupling factor transport system permease/ATP-binding protein